MKKQGQYEDNIGFLQKSVNIYSYFSSLC
jgi:hypothetical protein